MPPAVTSDTLLKSRATSLRALLNVGHRLRLFKNDLVPAPNTARSAFTEANFGGYASVDVSFKWGPISRAQVGQWVFDLALVTFTRTGGPDNTIFGWYLDDGTNVPFSFRFAAPIDTAVKPLIPLSFRLGEWSRSLFP